MPLAHDILLLHEAGPDRQAVASYLERQGLTTMVCDDLRQALAHLGREPVNARAVVLAHQARLAGAAPASIDVVRGHRTVLIVPGGFEPIPGFPHVIQEPFFLDQLLKTVKAAATPREATTAREAVDPHARGAESDLLRGLAHAINNPLTAALGWLRLLDGEIDDRDARKRLVTQTRAEIESLAAVAQALAHLASPGALGAVAFDLRHVASDRANTAIAEGARVAVRAAPARSFPVSGNPATFDLLLRLLLAPAYASNSIEPFEIAVDEQNGMVQLAVKDPKGRLPDPEIASDLGRLFRVERHQRALAIALGTSLARRAGGTFRCEAALPAGATYVLSVPVVRGTLGAAQGAP